jgi:putative ABC transport system permease protein
MDITLRLAWRNLWRQPRRTWLTTGAMIFSNIILVFMVSLQFGMYGMMIDNTLAVFTGHLQVQAPGYKDDKKMRQTIPDAASLAAELRTGLNIETVAARGAAFALASSEDRSFGVQVVGVQPDYEPLVSTLPGLISEGSYLSDNYAQEAVIGSVLARNLKVKLGDELTVLGSGRDGSFAAGIVIIGGIFDSGMADLDRSIIQIPLGTFQDVFFMEGAAHEIVVTTADLDLVDAAVANTRSLLPADSDLVVYDWDALQPSLKQAIQADLAGAWFMYGILIILVTFSVLNTVLMSVLERTKEFGIVMALGLTPGRLGRLVVLETIMMGFMGFAIGLAAGAALILYFGYNGFSYPGMDEMADQFNMPARIYPTVQWLPLFLGPSIVFIGTVIASIYPAARLNWLQPVQAMRAA